MLYTFSDCILNTDLYTLYRAGEPIKLEHQV